jgi:glycosyltransferase involved in cell wall biosynthesis
MRYAGIKNGKISILSEQVIQNKDLDIIQIPPELEHLSNTDLIVTGRFSQGTLKSKLAKIPAKNLKVAFVGGWRISCGLSTYFENLVPEIAKHISEFKLFIEENDNPTKDIYQFGDNRLNENQISICWKRGESLQKLVKELKEYDPQIIIFNHEFGIWSNTCQFMAALTQLSNYRCIIIQHSIFPNHQDKTIIESFFPEIIVHSNEAKNALKNIKQIQAKIHVIEHGCYDLIPNRLWNFYRSNHTLLQMGFGFKYKNYESSINTVSLLKNKYPDIFLTLVFSESDFYKVGHQEYYDELMNLIQGLKLEENVAIIRGFQSDYVAESFLLTNKILLLPYISEGVHFVYGSSGMVRKGFSAQIPVITSSIPHFKETPSIKCEAPSEMADQIDLLFSNSKTYRNQIEKQNNFIIENNWEKTALKYIKAFEA